MVKVWNTGFGLVLTVVCIGMAVCVYGKKLRIIQASAVVALVVFLGIVFGSTVFTRIGTVRQYELLPFWSWREVICNHDRELLKENLLNFILLLPAGILLPLIANHKIKWYQALLIGILMSATIELSQLILCVVCLSGMIWFTMGWVVWQVVCLRMFLWKAE